MTRRLQQLAQEKVEEARSVTRSPCDASPDQLFQRRRHYLAPCQHDGSIRRPSRPQYLFARPHQHGRRGSGRRGGVFSPRGR
uniref:Uncharacterized protein n=1 Tax=Zea mays TaxID=4577 RepID=C4J1W4_MAIZE|nr:unknown [Zea mays]